MATLAPTRTWRAEGAEAVAPAKAREVREGWIKTPGKKVGNLWDQQFNREEWEVSNVERT